MLLAAVISSWDKTMQSNRHGLRGIAKALQRDLDVIIAWAVAQLAYFVAY